MPKSREGFSRCDAWRLGARTCTGPVAGAPGPAHCLTRRRKAAKGSWREIKPSVEPAGGRSSCLKLESSVSPILVVAWWQWFLVLFEIGVGGGAMVHVILRKRDPRAAAYWIAIILLVPLAGAALYLLLGINLIRRRARFYREATRRIQARADAGAAGSNRAGDLAMGPLKTPAALATGGHCGNAVEILLMATGDAASGRSTARESVSQDIYIRASGIGSKFVATLERAKARGVEVRVMIDDAGTRYTWPPVTRELGVRVALHAKRRGGCCR